MKAKDLVPNPDNPRNITDAKLAQLKKSLEEYGDLSGIVFNRRTGNLSGGTQRSKNLDQNSEVVITEKFEIPTRTGTVALGYVEHRGERFSYREVDWNKKREMAANIAANKAAGEWDLPQLEQWMRELASEDDFDTELTMFDDKDLEDFDLEDLSKNSDKNGLNDEDDVPEKPVGEPRTRTGDLYQLGAHRLLCGDSTDFCEIDRLMIGEKANLIFTDPPYNLASDAKLLAARGLRDSYDKLKESNWDHNFSFENTFPIFDRILADDASIYICTSHFLFGKIQDWLAVNMDLTNFIVWAKPNPMPSLSKRHWTWSTELICYATKGKHTFNFPKEGHALNVWTVNKNQKNDLHPTMKPVEIPERAIVYSSNAKDVVVDLFLGSGTTVIACEKTDRKCYGMEIDPHYCDIIVERWEKYTGQKASLLHSQS